MNMSLKSISEGAKPVLKVFMNEQPSMPILQEGKEGEVLTFHNLLMTENVFDEKDMQLCANRHAYEQDSFYDNQPPLTLENDDGKTQLEDRKYFSYHKFIFDDVQNSIYSQHVECADNHSTGDTNTPNHESLKSLPLSQERADEGDRLRINESVLPGLYLYPLQPTTISDRILSEQMHGKNINPAYRKENVSEDLNNLEARDLTEEEQSLINDFLQNPVRRSSNQNLFFAKVERTFVAQKNEGSLFLTPVLPFNMLENESIQLEERDDRASHFKDLTQAIQDVQNPTHPLQKMELTEFTKESIVNLTPQTPSHQNEVKTNPTYYLSTFQSSEFIAHLKEQFQKINNSVEKKLTVHMKSDNKNLTIVFNMSEEKGLQITFRTKDVEWKNLLEKSKKDIEALTKDMPQQVHIRYLGE
jgi:hypothetical protein